MKNDKEKNGFLITWISCIVLLLTFCYFGINNSLRGTRAADCHWDIDLKQYVGDGCVTNDDGQTEIPSSSSTPSSSQPSSSVPSSSKPASSVPASSGGGCDPMLDYNCCVNAGYSWYDGICITGNPNGSSSSEDFVGSCTSGYQTVPDGMVCDSYSNGCYSNCYSMSDIIGGGSTGGDSLDTTGPSCGGTGSGWTVSSCIQFGNAWDNTSHCCEVTKVTEDEANSSTKKTYDNGSYTVTVNKSDGSVLQYNYNADGKLMSIITTDAAGNQDLDTTENSNLDGSIINYYNNYAECYYMAEGTGSDCVLYKGTYITENLAKSITYSSEELCKQTTGGECNANYNEETGKWTYTADDCVCEEDDSCIDEPTPTPGTPSNPTIPSTPSVPSDPSTPSSSSSKPSSSSPSSDGNVTENPQTGQIVMFIVWVMGFVALGYSIWYFMKNNKKVN